LSDLSESFTLLEMQHTANVPPVSASEPDINPVFSVLIAYEDLESGKQAKKTYDFLAEKIGRDCQFTNQMWNFDVLGIPKLREIAVKDAAMADIIILSCRGELPSQVKSWIEAGLASPGNAMALIALLGRAQASSAPSAIARAYLEQVAKRANLAFFAQPQESAGPFHFQRDASFEGSLLQRDTSGPRWGINE
jgi:hypothetical protein